MWRVEPTSIASEPCTNPLIGVRAGLVGMALLEQWRSQRPWLRVGLAGVGGLVAGAPGALVGLLPWGLAFSRGSISTRTIDEGDHPLRRRVLSVLEEHPGLTYRELQRQLGAANGTLRHHLDVLVTRRSITVVPVNGRTCHYAGAPTQREELLGMGLEDDEKAAALLPHGLSTVQRLIIEALAKPGRPASQAALARSLGRSRATVHSAVKVLRRRGLVHADELKLAPHLEGLAARELDYEWNDERQR